VSVRTSSVVATGIIALAAIGLVTIFGGTIAAVVSPPVAPAETTTTPTPAPSAAAPAATAPPAPAAPSGTAAASPSPNTKNAQSNADNRR